MAKRTNSVSRTEVSDSPGKQWRIFPDEFPESADYLATEQARLGIRELVLSHQIYKLRMLRKALGVTQVELAARLGVSQIRISQIENGKLERFELGTLLRYVEALGGSLELNVVLGAERLNLLEIEQIEASSDD
jgi:DNA-binding XRE family transcriptional regulator